MYLHEEILLLAMKDDSGKIDWKAGHYPFVMAGGILAELMLGEHVKFAEDKKKLLEVTGTSVLENEILNEALGLMKNAKRRRNIGHWVNKFANMKGLRNRTARGLCRQGILKEEESKVLVFFTSKRFPAINPKPERQLIARLERAIFTDDPDVGLRTAILVSLANPAGMLAIPFTGKALRQRKKRIKAITSGELIGEATGQAIQAMQAAIVMIAVMPAITASAGASAGTGGGC